MTILDTILDGIKKIFGKLVKINNKMDTNTEILVDIHKKVSSGEKVHEETIQSSKEAIAKKIVETKSNERNWTWVIHIKKEGFNQFSYWKIGLDTDTGEWSKEWVLIDFRTYSDLRRAGCPEYAKIQQTVQV